MCGADLLLSLFVCFFFEFGGLFPYSLLVFFVLLFFNVIPSTFVVTQVTIEILDRYISFADITAKLLTAVARAGAAATAMTVRPCVKVVLKKQGKYYSVLKK